MTNVPTNKYGILGGTFDPVTLGHLGLARSIQNLIRLDQIWFVPAWQSPYKQHTPLTDPNHRLNMLKEAVVAHPNYKISSIELDQKKVSYTIDTLTTLQTQHPETDWYLILGMDTFQSLSGWKNVRGILQKVHLVVATRPGYSIDPATKDPKTLVHGLPFSYELDQQANRVQTFVCQETGKTLVVCDIEPLDISSSEVRERIKTGLSVKKMLPPEVEEYIMAHRLYQANPRPQPE